MGVNYSLPLDYRPLEEILNMSLDRLTQKRIESVVEEVTAEKEKI